MIGRTGGVHDRWDRETQALKINADLKLWMVEGANIFCAAS
jgi:hypothetical protein